MILVRFPRRRPEPSLNAPFETSTPLPALGNKLQILAGASPDDLRVVEILVDLILERLKELHHMRHILIVLAVVWTVSDVPLLSAQSACGLKPLKPLVPLGCQDVVAQCQCDLNGQNCAWAWICVPK